ncbi:MAG: hypothetical protein WCA46_03550, partial [Actinocatenispora sp.]
MTSDTPDRNTDSRDTSQSGTRGRLFDTALYQAWALDGDDTWRYLPVDATADAPADPPGATWRERVRDGALRCPFPGCGAAFSGVRRGAGRVAFVHPKAGGTHSDKQSKETLWRLAAQQSVARWATGRYPGATVQIGGGDLPTAPDVLITVPGSGRIAVECRYSAFPDAEWQERHEAYRKDDIADLWLLGNSGPFARKATGEAELLRPPAVVTGMITAGVTVAWLNPFVGLVGTPTPAEAAGTVAVTESSLADWSLSVGGSGTAVAEPAADAPAAEATEPVTEPVAVEEPAAAEPVAAEPAVAAASTADAGADADDTSDEVPQIAEQEAA